MFAEYLKHGWKLCAIPAGKKSPTAKAWNTKPITSVTNVKSAGLLHALSGTCALDIDDLGAAIPWLAARGVDLEALIAADDAVQISSGRPHRAKLLFRMKHPLRTFRPKGSGLELRCATAAGDSVQDVLPPSIHPETHKPYEWAGGILADWTALPPIPAALLGVWRNLAESECEAPAVAPQPVKIDLVKLRKAAFAHTPDCEYDEWIKVGMQLHQGTEGDGAGFDIWRDWSKGMTRAEYPGDVVLKSHWLSFNSDMPNAVTGEALAAELPTETDDFEIMVDVPTPAPTGAAARRAAFRESLFSRFVFISLEEEYFDMDRAAKIGYLALKHMFTPFMPLRNGKLMDPVKELMESPLKSFVEAQAFHPGEGITFEHEGKKFANTFRASSLPAPIEPMKDELDRIEWLFNRITDETFREWLRQFYAHMVQRPQVKIRTAPLIWSKRQGNGKTTMAHTIPKLLAGEEYYQEVDQNNLNADFNDYLIGKWVASLTEFRAGTRGERANIAKKCERWVADDMLSLAIKSGRGCIVPNYLVITASSNHEDAACIDKENRKWSVYNMSEVPKMTKAEKAWLFEGFIKMPRCRGVLRHYFLNVPITTFDPNEDALVTKDRQDMIEASLPLDEELLVTAFEQCAEPLNRDVAIISDVADYVRKHCLAKPTNDRIGKILARAPFNGAQVKFRAGNGTYRAVVLRRNRFWLSASGTAIMTHINGDDESVAVQDDLLL